MLELKAPSEFEFVFATAKPAPAKNPKNNSGSAIQLP
jgi:hypothetical protein